MNPENDPPDRQVEGQPPVIVPTADELIEMFGPSESGAARLSRTLRSIAAFQIIGSALAMVFAVLMFGMVFTGFINAVGHIFASIIYGLGVYGGFLLWKGEYRGLAVSSIAQCAQVPYLVFDSFQYDIFAFLRIGFAITNTRWVVKFDVGLAPGLTILHDGATQFGLNVLAIVIVVWFLRNRQAIRELFAGPEDARIRDTDY